MKQCTRCKETKPLEMFTKDKKAKDGVYGYCKICSKENTAKNYATPHGRANKLIHTMHNSKGGKRANMEKTLTFKDIVLIVETGRCQLTNLPFDFQRAKKTSKNPYAPSLDRIDSQKGYTKENCRIVLAAVNDALGEYDDNDILPILKALVKGLEKNAKQKSATPIPTRLNRKSNNDPQSGTILTAGAGQNGDDINNHSRAIQGQDVNHRAKASSADSMGHRDKQMATSQQLDLLEGIGE